MCPDEKENRPQIPLKGLCKRFSDVAVRKGLEPSTSGVTGTPTRM